MSGMGRPNKRNVPCQIIEVELALSGKKIALFGSYGWGDGQWMRDWEDRCNAVGARLVCESVMANNAPGADDLDACKSLGAALA